MSYLSTFIKFCCNVLSSTLQSSLVQCELYLPTVDGLERTDKVLYVDFSQGRNLKKVVKVGFESTIFWLLIDPMVIIPFQLIKLRNLSVVFLPVYYILEKIVEICTVLANFG